MLLNAIPSGMELSEEDKLFFYNQEINSYLYHGNASDITEFTQIPAYAISPFNEISFKIKQSKRII